MGAAVLSYIFTVIDMQITDATYNTIVSGRYQVEYKAVIAGVTYSQTDIVVSGGFPTETAALFEKFGIGNAVAGSLEIRLKPSGVIPPMALIEVYFRVKNASLTSSWYPKGKYYIDTRQSDKNGIIHFTAYDKMLMTEYVFMESGTWTSTDAETTVDMICSDTGISLNAETRTVLAADPKAVPYVPIIGPSGTTAREMLEWIAVLYGGNFIIDELGELKLIQLKEKVGKNLYNRVANPIISGAIASADGQDTASNSRCCTSSFIPVKISTTYTVSSDIAKVFVLEYASDKSYLNIYSGWKTATTGYTFTTSANTRYIRLVFAKSNDGKITPGEISWVQVEVGSSATPYEPYDLGIDLGVQMESLDVSPAFAPIDRVIIRSGNEDGVGYRSPDVSDYVWYQMPGRVLRAACPWTSQVVADGVLAIVDGFTYQPYEAGGANLNPAAQLGDKVTVNGTTSWIYSETLTLNARCAADISAPYDEEVDHEYPYRSPAQRRIDNAATMQDIDGMVTQEDLQTAGQTSINGSNIHSGTIELGGAGNGNGQMVLVDENDVEFARWDKDRITIFDDTTGLTYESSKFKIVRQGDDASSQFGIFLGTGQLYEQFFPGTYPNECTPFMQIKGALDYTDNTSFEGSVSVYPEHVVIMNGASKSANITAVPEAVATPVTRTSGAATTFSATLNVWGRLAMLTIVITHGSSVAAYGDYFVGNILSGYEPVSTVHAHTSWYEHQILASLEPNGSIVLRDASGSSSAFNSGTATVTFTYLF